MEDIKWLESEVEDAKKSVEWEERHNYDKLYTSDSCKKTLDNLEFRLELSKKGVPYEVRNNNQLLILGEIYIYTWTSSFRKKGSKVWQSGLKNFYSLLDEMMWEYKKDKATEVEQAYYEWVFHQPKSMRGSFIQFEAGYLAAKRAT